MQKKITIRSATWITCGLATFVTLLLLEITGSDLKVKSFLPITSMILLTFCVHVVYTKFRPVPLISRVSGGVTVLFWAVVITGVATLAALRLNAPLIDADLASIDEAFGVNTSVLVGWVASHPVPAFLLNVAYKSTAPLVLAAVLALACMHQEKSMWELCLAFSGAGTSCILISAMAPAVGAFVHYKISPDTLALLPKDSGVYHLPIFTEYRSGTSGAIELEHMSGVVTFPSFHAAMAFMIGHAFRGLRWISGPVWFWSGIMVISAIPIGGHYAVDLVAGVGVWAIFALFARVRMP